MDTQSNWMEPILQLNRLSVCYGTSPVLHDIDLCVGRGEVVGVVGESGSGKSTLALAIVGLLSPEARVSSGSLKLKRDATVGMIFQEPSAALHPMWSVGFQISQAILARRRCGREQASVEAVALLRELQFSNPEEIYRSYPHQLSGGQQQRVLIAQALAGHPALLIADEPTSSLDTSTQSRILSLLKEIAGHRELGILFITHDPALLTGFAHRVVVLHQGRIVEEGAFASICRNPQHPYTRLLLSSVWPELPWREDRHAG
jgi:ABC-type dipeptide/oligopeptide/nickel transport system ATPase component